MRAVPALLPAHLPRASLLVLRHAAVGIARGPHLTVVIPGASRVPHVAAPASPQPLGPVAVAANVPNLALLIRAIAPPAHRIV